MASVILEGIDALRIAKYIADCMGQEAYSLEPDFVQTARLYMPDDNPRVLNWVYAIERWRDLNNFFGANKNFRVLPDGPPYSVSGGEPSVQGTLL